MGEEKVLRQIALDTETTGMNEAGGDDVVGDHRIIEIGCVEIVDRKITGRSMQVFLNPDREVSAGAIKVHGITNDFLADKPHFKDVAGDFIDFITGAELLIHNARFDVSFIDSEFRIAGIKEKTAQLCNVTDTIKVATEKCPGHQVNLDNLCKIYGIDSSARTMHGALLDAELLAEVYLAMTGGQTSFDFGDTQEQKVYTFTRWKRPEGVKLPVMPLEKGNYSAHMMGAIDSEISAALNNKKGVPPVASSPWGPEFSLDMSKAPVQGEDEDKGAFKKRVSAFKKEKKAEAVAKLLTAEDLKAFEEYSKVQQDLYDEWLNRVNGG
ncbi:MAG: DNA polymerase III subunit epsilon [Succinivibrio sp.]|nr:DNA polymerase III subunit epsilon [Succinivibrio sp.]